jgi:hypothetical protein
VSDGKQTMNMTWEGGSYRSLVGVLVRSFVCRRGVKRMTMEAKKSNDEGKKEQNQKICEEGRLNSIFQTPPIFPSHHKIQDTHKRVQKYVLYKTTIQEYIYFKK